MNRIMNKSEPGKLYVVATPIGNMGDISKRAIETLKSVDFVACEDTRSTGKLLSLLGIKNKMIALHQHSRDESIDKILDKIKNNKNVAYVSDAGTPAISDPGQKLVKIARKKNIDVIPIAGPSAVSAAVSVSGLVRKEFYFVGFLPKKKGRQTKLKQLSNVDAPVVIYENALRLEKTLNDIKKYFGKDVEVFVAREMTKMFEEYFGGTIDDVIVDLKNHKLKGEITLIAKKQDTRNNDQTK